MTQLDLKLLSQKLQEVVQSIPGLGPGSRVLDVGCGTGVLIPVLQVFDYICAMPRHAGSHSIPSSNYSPCQQEAGVTDILELEVAPAMLDSIRSRHDASRLGNEAGVRTWLGTVASLPAYQAWGLVCCCCWLLHSIVH